MPKRGRRAKKKGALKLQTFDAVDTSLIDFSQEQTVEAERLPDERLFNCTFDLATILVRLKPFDAALRGGAGTGVSHAMADVVYVDVDVDGMLFRHSIEGMTFEVAMPRSTFKQFVSNASLRNVKFPLRQLVVMMENAYSYSKSIPIEEASRFIGTSRGAEGREDAMRIHVLNSFTGFFEVVRKFDSAFVSHVGYMDVATTVGVVAPDRHTGTVDYSLRTDNVRQIVRGRNSLNHYDLEHVPDHGGVTKDSCSTSLLSNVGGPPLGSAMIPRSHFYMFRTFIACMKELNCELIFSECSTNNHDASLLISSGQLRMTLRMDGFDHAQSKETRVVVKCDRPCLEVTVRGSVLSRVIAAMDFDKCMGVCVYDTKPQDNVFTYSERADGRNEQIVYRVVTFEFIRHDNSRLTICAPAGFRRIEKR
jgi:hypothetical protein